jgi:hypothetical protein
MSLYERLSYMWHRVFNPKIAATLFAWSEFQKEFTVELFRDAWIQEKDRQKACWNNTPTRITNYDPGLVSPMGMILLAYLNGKPDDLRERMLTAVFDYEGSENRHEMKFAVLNDKYITYLTNHLRTDAGVLQRSAVAAVSAYLKNTNPNKSVPENDVLGQIIDKSSYNGHSTVFSTSRHLKMLHAMLGTDISPEQELQIPDFIHKEYRDRDLGADFVKIEFNAPDVPDAVKTIYVKKGDDLMCVQNFSTSDGHAITCLKQKVARYVTDQISVYTISLHKSNVSLEILSHGQGSFGTVVVLKHTDNNTDSPVVSHYALKMARSIGRGRKGYIDKKDIL